MAEGTDSSTLMIENAARGKEITDFDVFGRWGDVGPMERIKELVQQMHADVPAGGEDIIFGQRESQKIRYWKAESGRGPLVLFVHGGSWRAGTYLDSVGSKKVDFLTKNGYAFASVNYTLFPEITVAEQVQEIANSLAHLLGQATNLGFDGGNVFLVPIRRTSRRRVYVSTLSAALSPLMARTTMRLPRYMTVLGRLQTTLC
jgi:hypothetical protein